MEQGSLTDCVYCTLVHPDAAGDCPRCGGQGRIFRPVRMMDGPTSRAQVLSSFFRFGEVWQAVDGPSEERRDALVSLLEEVSLYGFDPTLALAEAIRGVEEEGALGLSHAGANGGEES